MFQLGAGRVFGNPIGGNLATNPTPQFFGTTQDLSLEIDQKLEELRGTSQFPDDVGPTDRKISGKLSFGKIELALLNQLFFADTQVTGLTGIASLENHPIPTTPYQVTPVPPESGTYIQDLGVVFGSSGGLGQQLVKVASAPTTGQYTVAAGVYTFAAADTTKAVQISYAYSLATVGATQQINNQVLGFGPVFELWIQLSYQVDAAGTPVNGIYFPAVRAGKLGAPLKRAGYMIQTLDIEAYPTSITTAISSIGNVAKWFQGTP